MMHILERPLSTGDELASVVKMNGVSSQVTSWLGVGLAVVAISGMSLIACSQEDVTVPDATGQEILDFDVLAAAPGLTSEGYEEFWGEYWAIWGVVWSTDQFFQRLEEFVETMQRALIDRSDRFKGSIQGELLGLLQSRMDVAVNGKRVVMRASWMHLVSSANHDWMIDTISATRDLVSGFGKLLLESEGDCWWEDKADPPRLCSNFDRGTISASDQYIRAMDDYLASYGGDQ